MRPCWFCWAPCPCWAAPGNSLPTVTAPFAPSEVADALGAVLAGADDPALGIEGLGTALDAVAVERRRDLHARPATADDARDDVLDLELDPLLDRRLALLEAEAGQALLALRAVGQQPAALVDDRDPLGLQPVHGRGDEMAHGPDLRPRRARRRA